MKKTCLLLAVLIFAAVGLSAQTNPYNPNGSVPAVQTEKKWPSAMVFARFGSFSPSDGFFKSIYGSGFTAGLEGRIHIIDNFFVALAGGFFQKTGALTVTQEKTTLTISPLDVMAVYHIRLSGIFSPYVGAGGSLCLYTEKNALGDAKDSGFGPALCGGVTARWGSFGVDARLKYSSVKIKPFDLEAGLGGLTLSLAAGVIF